MGGQPRGSGYLYELLRLIGVPVNAAGHVQDLLGRPVAVVVFVAATWCVAHLGSKVIRRSLARIRDRTAAGGDYAQASRVDTVRRILANAWRVTVGVIGGVSVLSVLGINLAPFLAGATVIGATIGFGAQSLVRDFLSGFLILLEDQYRIGDVVELPNLIGVVDEVSLRVTRLRAEDGTLWYIPNGEIRRLGNTSRDGGRAYVQIVVPLTHPLATSTEVIENAAREALATPELQAKCLSEPTLLGVSTTTLVDATIELEVATAASAGDAVARALRRSIADALVNAGILPFQTA